MIKAIQTIILVGLFFSHAPAQNNEIENYVGKGVELHDKGDYAAAIREFQKALSIDGNSPLANFERANTYFAMKEYEKAIDHADKVIALGTRYVDQAYIAKGSALDMQDKPQEAIKVYQEGIKHYPRNHLLYYNLAFTSYTIKEDDQTEEALEKGLKLNPSHASSHLLMGYLMSDMNDRVKSLLALYNFLMLEPTGERAKEALALVDQEMKSGVVRENDKKTSIYIPDRKTDSTDNFRPADFWLSMLEAGKNLDKNKDKSDAELFMQNSKAFLGLLGTLKKDNTGFWWNYYVAFYEELFKDKNREEAFSYLISASWDDKKVMAWIKKNKNKVQDLAKWYQSYARE
jgi:tetratricopeptide (TPR) repeat protein